MTRGPRWTEVEDRLIRETAHLPLADAARQVGRGVAAVSARRTRLLHPRPPTSGRVSPRFWRPEEDTLLRERPEATATDLGRQLGRSAQAVTSRRLRLGLSRDTHPGRRKSGLTAAIAAHVGQQIAEGRRAHDWSRADLARRAGVVEESVLAWEHGVSCPDLTSLLVVAEALGVAPGALLPATLAAATGGPKEGSVSWTP